MPRHRPCSDVHRLCRSMHSLRYHWSKKDDCNRLLAPKQSNSFTWAAVARRFDSIAAIAAVGSMCEWKRKKIESNRNETKTYRAGKDIPRVISASFLRFFKLSSWCSATFRPCSSNRPRAFSRSNSATEKAALWFSGYVDGQAIQTHWNTVVPGDMMQIFSSESYLSSIERQLKLERQMCRCYGPARPEKNPCLAPQAPRSRQVSPYQSAPPAYSYRGFLWIL